MIQRLAGLCLLACTGLFLLTALTGCYEGWTPPNTNGIGPPQPPPPPPPPPPKPIGYVLLQTVTMGSDAIASNTCFPLTGIRTFRSNEWGERSSAILTAVQGLADTVEPVAITVPASDCNALATIQAAAINQAPWGSDPSPENDTSGKELLSLTVILWEGDPAVQPPPVVVATNWPPWVNLQQEGRDAKSLTYFVVSNPANGYFTNWQASESPTTTLAGTPINQVDPTAGGIAARDTLVKKDTAALVAFITGQIQ